MKSVDYSCRSWGFCRPSSKRNRVFHVTQVLVKLPHFAAPSSDGSHFMQPCSLANATKLDHLLSVLRALDVINHERRYLLQTESLPLMQLTCTFEFPEGWLKAWLWAKLPLGDCVGDSNTLLVIAPRLVNGPNERTRHVSL